MQLAKPWRIAGWSSAIALLALPAITMQFTSEVRWETGDFLVMAGLLLLLGLGLEITFRLLRSRTARIAGAALLLAAFLIVWAELAVGLFD